MVTCTTLTQGIMVELRVDQTYSGWVFRLLVVSG